MGVRLPTTQEGRPFPECSRIVHAARYGGRPAVRSRSAFALALACRAWPGYLSAVRLFTSPQNEEEPWTRFERLSCCAQRPSQSSTAVLRGRGRQRDDCAHSAVAV